MSIAKMLMCLAFFQCLSSVTANIFLSESFSFEF